MAAVITYNSEIAWPISAILEFPQRISHTHGKVQKVKMVNHEQYHCFACFIDTRFKPHQSIFVCNNFCTFVNQKEKYITEKSVSA
jgi:ribosomal protein L37AE/L43A